MNEWMIEHYCITILVMSILVLALGPWILGWLLEYNTYVYKAFNR